MMVRRKRERVDWETYYCRSLARKANLDETHVRVVTRHNHVERWHEGQLVVSGWCAELEYRPPDGDVRIFYAWDEPPFIVYEKKGPIKEPSDALTAFVVQRWKAQQT